MKTYERYCPTCNKIIRGRTDKKYCDDYCRNTYNNFVNSATNNLIRKVNAVLRRNRKVMEILIPPGQQEVRTRKFRMVEYGFDFRYCTHTELSGQRKRTLFFCYEYGYILFRGGWVRVIRRPRQTAMK